GAAAQRHAGLAHSRDARLLVRLEPLLGPWLAARRGCRLLHRSRLLDGRPPRLPVGVPERPRGGARAPRRDGGGGGAGGLRRVLPGCLRALPALPLLLLRPQHRSRLLLLDGAAPARPRTGRPRRPYRVRAPDVGRRRLGRAPRRPAARACSLGRGHPPRPCQRAPGKRPPPGAHHGAADREVERGRCGSSSSPPTRNAAPTPSRRSACATWRPRWRTRATTSTWSISASGRTSRRQLRKGWTRYVPMRSASRCATSTTARFPTPCPICPTTGAWSSPAGP